MDDRYDDDRGRDAHRRNWSERAGDEIRSWFGDDQAQRRRRVDEMEDHSRPPSRADLRDAPFDRERWERERWQTRDRWELRDRNDRDSRDRMDPDFSDHPPRPHDRGDGRHDRDRSDLAGRGRTEERVHEVMTRNVATVHPQDSIEHAARLMLEHDCGALPVVQGNGRLIGMITDRDVVIRLIAHGHDPLRARVEDAMSEDVYPVRMEDDVDTALRVMSRHRVRRVPVVDDRDRILGMISQADLARLARRQRSDLRPAEIGETVSEISEPVRRR